MSAKNSYRLINPYIEGSLDTVVSASNSFSAGKKIYNSISKFFTNHLDNFYMTVQNVETKDLSHFKINEKRGDSGMVDYKLVKIDASFDPDIERNLTEKVDKLSQSGGRYEDDSPTESSTESDYFKYPAQPITRFVYFYLPYYKLKVVGLSPLDYRRLFVPMFSFPINPTLEVRFDFYYKL